MHPFDPRDTELVAVFLSGIVGAVLLVLGLAALLMKVSGYKRRSATPRLPALDEQVAGLWQQQLKSPRPFALERRQQAA